MYAFVSVHAARRSGISPPAAGGQKLSVASHPVYGDCGLEFCDHSLIVSNESAIRGLKLFYHCPALEFCYKSSIKSKLSRRYCSRTLEKNPKKHQKNTIKPTALWVLMKNTGFPNPGPLGSACDHTGCGFYYGINWLLKGVLSRKGTPSSIRSRHFSEQILYPPLHRTSPKKVTY